MTNHKRLYLIERAVFVEAGTIGGKKIPHTNPLWRWFDECSQDGIIRELGKPVGDYVHFFTPYGTFAIPPDMIEEITPEQQ